VKRDSSSLTPKKSVAGRTLVIGLLASIVAVAGLVLIAGMTGGSTHVPQSKPGVGFTMDPKASAAPADSAPGMAAFADGGALTKTLHDRAVHDELRKRILAGWAAEAAPEVAAAARQGRFVPAPTTDGGGMDPQYIREVFKEEFYPMAKKCYEELLSRKDASAGRVEVSFSIVADARLGGIVEDVSIASDGGVADDKMTTCMRESMSGVSFRPPAHGGVVTVVYPILFSADDRDE
jgi:uncharacterized membrane protein